MKKIFGPMILTFTIISNVYANGFGPWPQDYFQKGERFYCGEGGECIVPREDDLEVLKKDFLELSSRRISRINEIQESLELESDKVLALSQKFEEDLGDNNLSEIYLKLGSELKEAISSELIEDARLLVSDTSPFLTKIEQLRVLLLDMDKQIADQPDADLKAALLLLKKQKYKEFALSEEYQSILEILSDLNKKFFKAESDSERRGQIEAFLSGGMNISEHISFENCPKKVKEKLITEIGELFLTGSSAKTRSSGLHFEKDISIIGKILNGNNRKTGLTVSCSKAGFLKGMKPKYDFKKNKLKLRYKSKLDEQSIEIFSISSRDLIIDQFLK